MKILYVVYFDVNAKHVAGISKKITSQIKSLTRLGQEVDLAYVVSDKLIVQNNVGDIKKVIKIRKGINRYRYSIAVKTGKLLKNDSYDLIYVRLPYTLDFSVLKLFKKAKNLGITCVLEVPTYPNEKEYQIELNNLRNNTQHVKYCAKKLLVYLHKLTTRQVNKLVDKIVTFNPYDKIWGVNTIILENGIDVDCYNPVYEKKQKKTIQLTAVANVSSWHGYDRVLVGLSQYYSVKRKTNLEFHIVGRGRAVPELKEKVNQLGLDDKVIFHGILTGMELENIYASTDVGISSLGLHRIGLKKASTLKTKEYCSMGVPFIYGYTESSLPLDFKYALKVEDDDSPINITEVLNFYEQIKEDEYKEYMHVFAREHYDWTLQMEKFLRELNKEGA